MAVLFLDDDVFQNKEELAKSKEEFVSEINKYIESHYTGEDSEKVYALFNPAQVQLLQNYFKGFSVEMYKELNGTVELQIQKKNAKVKEKINKIAEFMGPINLDDWVYDGMVDGGKNNSQKCDLCPRPVRYAHFAVNKKTSECLRFGCNCAADFFSMDKGSLASMRTIQAKTLMDIKKIAYVVETKKFKDYYKYLGGSTGKVILEEGPQGLLDLMTFLVKWDKDGKLVMEGDKYVLQFGDRSKGVKSLQWIKEHIVSCLNADLDDDIYKPLEDRIVKRKVLKQEDKQQLNTAGYVKYAMKFVDLGLPVPESLMKKLNSIMTKATKQHHPDYIKYAQELLISHNLAKSSLLQKAFTDFIINYLASSITSNERDPELEYWGVRGVGTFHKTVLQWEAAMIKLLALKEFYSLISKGFVTEEEFNRYLKSRGYSGIYYNSDAIKAHVNRCMRLFMTKKEVIKNEDIDVVKVEGYSKYTLKGVDDKISLCLRNKRDNSPVIEDKKFVKVGKCFNSGEFTPETILVDIGLHYYAMQQSYKSIVHDSIKSVVAFLQFLKYISDDKEAMRYLCALEKDTHNGTVHMSSHWRSYSVYNEDTFKRALDGVQIDEDFYNEMYEKYKDLLAGLKKDGQELYHALSNLYQNLSKPIIAVPPGKKVTASNINADYEDLALNTEKEKTNKDYFKEYCELLTSKRGNKKIQQYIYQQNLFALLVYKQMEPYAEMLKDIQESYITSNQKAEEKRLFSYMKLNSLKEVLHRHLNTPDMDTFIKFIAYRLYGQNVLDDYHYGYEITNKVRRFNIDIQGFDAPLKEATVMDAVDKHLPKAILDKMLENRDLFENLYETYKELFLVLKNSKGFIKFKDFYGLLNETSEDVENFLNGKDLITCSAFEHKVDGMLYDTGKYDSIGVQFEGDIYEGIKRFLEKTIVYKGVKDNLDAINNIILDVMKAMKEEEARIEREKRLKGPYLDTLRTYLKEHIDFFEVDVNDMKNKYPSKYGRLSDVSIRQKVALKTVSYQHSNEESARFIKELELLGRDKWSKGVAEVVDAFSKSPATEYGKHKVYAEALRAEMYNHKLIYNHFDVTYKLLKNLSAIDLTVLSVDEIQKIGDILKYYYIFKSEVDYIYNVLVKYNLATVDVPAEVKNIPEPVIKNIQDIIDNLSDKADSTGYTGVEKADLVKAHTDFLTLESHLQGIVTTVCRYRNCTPKQLTYVNTAFAKLGLGTPDMAKQQENQEDVKDLALKIMNHPDFMKVPDRSRAIIETVSKTGRASSKQQYHLDNAKKLLNM